MKSTPASGARRQPSTVMALPPDPGATACSRPATVSAVFTRSVDNRGYLAALLDELAGLPLAVEFRHASWVTDRVFSEFTRRRVALVTVDTPDLPGLFPTLDIVTHPSLFYVRFHGRNARGWRSGNLQKQFDYSYGEDELLQWIDSRIVKMRQQASAGKRPALYGVVGTTRDSKQWKSGIG